MYVFLLCKSFGQRIWSCKIFDKFQVWFWRLALFWVCTWGKIVKLFFYFVPKILPPPHIWRQNLGLGWGLSFTTTRLQNNPWCRGEDKEMWRHLPLSLLQVASCGLVVHSWCWDFFSCQNHSELQRNYKRMDIIHLQFGYFSTQIVTFEEDQNCPPGPRTCETQWSF